MGRREEEGGRGRGREEGEERGQRRGVVPILRSIYPSLDGHILVDLVDPSIHTTLSSTINQAIVLPICIHILKRECVCVCVCESKRERKR